MFESKKKLVYHLFEVILSYLSCLLCWSTCIIWIFFFYSVCYVCVVPHSICLLSSRRLVGIDYDPMFSAKPTLPLVFWFHFFPFIFIICANLYSPAGFLSCSGSYITLGDIQFCFLFKSSVAIPGFFEIQPLPSIAVHRCPLHTREETAFNTLEKQTSR